MDEENPRRSYHRPHAAVPKELKRRYANPFWTSVSLNVRRNLTLLGRDREFLIGKCVENFGMGIGMAMIFLQSAAFPSGINGSVEVAEYFDGGCVEGSFDAEVSKCEFCFLSRKQKCMILSHVIVADPDNSIVIIIHI